MLPRIRMLDVPFKPRKAFDRRLWDVSRARQKYADKFYNLSKWAFEVTGYNRYGLYTHDVMAYDLPAVKETLRRLPKPVLDARNFRIIRATQLNYLKIYLPKEKWITYEQDLEYRYMEPYIEEIEKELLEIREFGCRNYSRDDWPAGEVK